MKLKQILFLSALFCALNSAKLLYTKSTSTKNVCGRNKQNCLYNSDCQCYCAVKGASRKKEANDKPIYVENDPYGHYCYCKQRDLDIENERHGKKKSSKQSPKMVKIYEHE